MAQNSILVTLRLIHVTTDGGQCRNICFFRMRQRTFWSHKRRENCFDQVSDYWIPEQEGLCDVRA
jgi:hypothetical protein